MPQSPDSPTPYESQYPELKLPEGGWKSSIPEHLLKDASPMDVWMMTEMSKNTQATEFACKGAVDLSRHMRTLNGKTYKTEKMANETQADVAILKDQMVKIGPITSTLTTAWSVATNKIFLVIFGMSILFLLGFNRDVLITIFKAWFG